MDQLFSQLQGKISPEDVDELKTCIRNTKTVHPSYRENLEKCTTFEEIWHLLERREIIEPGNYEFLKKMFEEMGRHDLTVDITLSQPKVDISKYAMSRSLGLGSFGSVHLFDLKEGNDEEFKQIAVKERKHAKKVSSDKECCTEVKILSKLNHPNVVKFLGCQDDGEKLLIFFEYMSEGSIAQRLEADGPFGEERTRRYTIDILKGLEYIHSQGVIHRDINGSNILLHSLNTAKLAGFGVSVEMYFLTSATSTVTIAGTVPFMAPEVVRNDPELPEEYGTKLDIWSVGCTMVQMLTSHPPWNQDANSIPQIISKIGSGAYPEYELPKDVSMETSLIMSKCFKSNPKERPSASELLSHILRVFEKDESDEKQFQPLHSRFFPPSNILPHTTTVETSSDQRTEDKDIKIRFPPWFAPDVAHSSNDRPNEFEVAKKELVEEFSTLEGGEGTTKQELVHVKQHVKEVSNAEEFFTEVEILGKLSHRNVVRFLGCKDDGGKHLIFLEHMSGGSIAQMLEAEGPFSEERTRRYTRDILQGLVYIHSKGVVHGNINGSNILLDSSDTAKLANFGNSFESSMFSGSWLPMRLYRAVAESAFGIMAPEILRGDMAPEYATKLDIWSVGYTVLQMLTPHQPWSHFVKHYGSVLGYDHDQDYIFYILDKELLGYVSKHARHLTKACIRIRSEDRLSASELLEVLCLWEVGGPFWMCDSRGGILVEDASYDDELFQPLSYRSMGNALKILNPPIGQTSIKNELGKEVGEGTKQQKLVRVGPPEVPVPGEEETNADQEEDLAKGGGNVSEPGEETTQEKSVQAELPSGLPVQDDKETTHDKDVGDDKSRQDEQSDHWEVGGRIWKDDSRGGISEVDYDSDDNDDDDELLQLRQRRSSYRRKEDKDKELKILNPPVGQTSIKNELGKEVGDGTKQQKLVHVGLPELPVPGEAETNDDREEDLAKEGGNVSESGEETTQRNLSQAKRPSNWLLRSWFLPSWLLFLWSLLLPSSWLPVQGDKDTTHDKDVSHDKSRQDQQPVKSYKMTFSLDQPFQEDLQDEESGAYKELKQQILDKLLRKAFGDDFKKISVLKFEEGSIKAVLVLELAGDDIEDLKEKLRKVEDEAQKSMQLVRSTLSLQVINRDDTNHDHDAAAHEQAIGNIHDMNIEGDLTVNQQIVINNPAPNNNTDAEQPFLLHANTNGKSHALPVEHHWEKKWSTICTAVWDRRRCLCKVLLLLSTCFFVPLIGYVIVQ